MLEFRPPVDIRRSVLLKRSIPYLIVIGLFGLALGFIVNILDPFIYTEKVRQIASPFLKNTILSLITTLALLVALSAQPLVGRWSDRSQSRWGPRLPFLTGGVAGLCFSLALITRADQLWLLIVAAMLASASSNTVQAAWQALIPDQVPQDQRGTAAAIKTLLEGLGAVAGVTVAGLALALGILWGAPLAAITLFVVILLVTFYTLQSSQDPVGQSHFRDRHSSSTGRLAQENSSLTLVRNLAKSTSFRREALPFFWWAINRILFWSAGISLRTFILNYLNDAQIVSWAEIETISNRFIIAVGAGGLLIIILSGILADRFGRRPLLHVAGLLAGGGTILLIFSRDLNWLLAAGGVIALGGGIFAGASWALATDLAPRAKGALYLGLANGATVIGSIAGRLGGPLIDGLNRLNNDQSLGYLAVFSLAALCFLGSSAIVLKIPGENSQGASPAGRDEISSGRK